MACPVAEAVTDGTLSVDGAAAIVSGLGEPSAVVTGAELLSVATVLVSRAGTSTVTGAAAPEDVARAARAQLDTDSVADFEAHRRSKRSLKWFQNSDGMTRLSALLDPESAAIIVGALTQPGQNSPGTTKVELNRAHAGQYPR